MKLKKHLHHIHIILMLGLLTLGFGLLYLNNYLQNQSLNLPQTFGVSYSPQYAKSLGLDPKKVYSSMLSDLKIKKIRLNAYWNEIEPKNNDYNFQDLDYYIDQASDYHAQVILTIGYKLPRWPECRIPNWVKINDTATFQKDTISMLRNVVTRYDQNPTLSAFQIENEPLFNFGVCPKADPEFLKTEVTFVKSLTKKPIILTDSGELSSWSNTMQLSDIFGTTLYRVVNNPVVGSIQYPLRPWFYRVKSDLIKHYFAPKNQKTIIAELQAEPWATQTLSTIPIYDQTQRYSINEFKEAVDFAHKTGFSETYFWGIEWWYYIAKYGHPEYLTYAKSLF